MVTNGSFENIGNQTLNFFLNDPSGNLPGWSGTGGGLDNDCVVVAASTNAGMCGEYGYDIYQMLTGLTAGDDYQVTFYQAAGQLYPYDTTEDDNWVVYFGDQYQTSDIMRTPGDSVFPWESETMNFVADSTSEVLGFLAHSTAINTPPILFLDGVEVTDQGPSAAPEPSTPAMLFLGLLAVSAARRLSRKEK